MCNERNQYLLCDNSIWNIHFQEQKKKIIKRHFCLSFSLLCLFIRCCKFVVIKTRLRHSTCWESDELINHLSYIIGSGRKQPPVFCKKTYSSKFCNFHRKIPVFESLFNKELQSNLITKKTPTQVVTSIRCCFDTINRK